MYPASKVKTLDKMYAPATISGSFNPYSSRWWWNGAILNKRRPYPCKYLVALKKDTCIITDVVSNMKIPDEMNNGKNIPVQEAIAPKAPPSAKEPVSPINTDALYRLCDRKPTQAPAIDAPNTARSEQMGRTAIDMPIKANAAVPAANPSRPSVKSIPFAKERKHNDVSTK